MQKPHLFEYLDVSQFLKDLYKFRKSSDAGFSYEAWAAELSFKSRAHLRSIVVGEIPLTENLISTFVDGLKLDAESAQYFTLLAKYSTASTPLAKQTYGKPLILLWKLKLGQVAVQDIAQFLSDALIPVVFTYLSFDDSASDAEEIARQLGYEASRVQSALKCLIWQKLVDGQVSDSGQVVYKTVQPFFKIPDVPNSPYLRNFHIEGLKLAEKAQEPEYPKDFRRFYSYFVALSPAEFSEVQKMIQDCNDRILALFDRPQLGERKIYRLNSQIFAVSGIALPEAVAESAPPAERTKIL